MLGLQALVRFGVDVPTSAAPSAGGGRLLAAKDTMQRRRPGVTTLELGAGGQTMRLTWCRARTDVEQ